jgi:hypothetical protein
MLRKSAILKKNCFPLMLLAGSMAPKYVAKSLVIEELVARVSVVRN